MQRADFVPWKEIAPDSVERRESMPPVGGQAPLDMPQMTVGRPSGAWKVSRVAPHPDLPRLAFEVAAAANVSRPKDWPKRMEAFQRMCGLRVAPREVVEHLCKRTVRAQHLDEDVVPLVVKAARRPPVEADPCVDEGFECVGSCASRCRRGWPLRRRWGQHQGGISSPPLNETPRVG